MSKHKLPFDTPDGFFEAQKSAIWKAAQPQQVAPNTAERKLPAWTVWFSSAAAAVALVVYWNVQTQSEACETFACLWEESAAQDLRIEDREFEEWMEDDLLFESMLIESIDV